jgi:putative ABC transport system permease protein
MVGMALAVGAVVAFVGIADGLSRSMLELYQRRGVHLVVTRSDSVNPLSGTIKEAIGGEIAALEGVEATCPGLVDILSFENLGIQNIVIQGWPDNTFMFQELTIVQGECLSETSHGKRELMLGKDLATNTKLKVGDTVTLVGEEFRVGGIYETFAGLENNMVIMLLPDAQRLTGKPGQITGCTIRVRSATPESINEIKGLIQSQVADKVHMTGKIKAAEPGDMLKNNTQINMVKAASLLISVVGLLISGILVLTVMLMSVFERTREIGILRAIGWRPWRVIRMILMESVILSLAGAVVGSVGALGLVWALSRLPQVNGAIPSTASPQIIATGFMIALVVGLFGAAYPAYRGARLLPTEALRHE